ncbi:MAG: pyridoxamine kinase [Bacteroidales bacterium]
MLKNKLKRVVAIHDLCGVGRVSLNVVIPTLSIMGFNVCPLPTALLSNHTDYPEFTFLDLTDEMEKIIAQWKKDNVKFDAFYSGYLGSPRQVKILSNFYKDFSSKDSLVVVDPVLGDNGQLYANYNQDMVIAMRELIKSADVITPNVTELELLLGNKLPVKYTDNDIKESLHKLSLNGPQIVIVTSVPVLEDDKKTSVYAYNRVGNRYWKITCPYLPAHYPGTGDTFTSVLTGSLLQGDNLPIAMERAVQLILQGIRASFGYDFDEKEGILLEKVLKNLEVPIQTASYEMI